MLAPTPPQVYKNSNGLKYHLDKGICEVDLHSLTTPETALLTSQHVDARIKVAHRPYWCKVPGCGKRYKNLNGIKYHANAAHPDLDFAEEVKDMHGSHLG